MTKTKEKRGFLETLREILSYTSKFMPRGIFYSIVDSVEGMLSKVDEKIDNLEKRIIKGAYTFLVIGVGVIFLTLALFFYLKDFLNLSNTLAFFYIGIAIFILGLLLKIGWSNK